MDNHKFDEWLELLDDDLEYLVPVRTTKGDSIEEEVTNENFIIKASKDYFKVTISRLKDNYGWASKQHSRTRRNVSNIIINNAYSSGNSIHVELTNNLLLIRTERDEYHPYILSALRRDTLKLLKERVLLTKRYVILDHSNIPMYNLYFPL